MMDDGTKGEAVPPGGCEIGDFDPFVAICYLLAPLQEILRGSFLAGFLSRTACKGLHRKKGGGGEKKKS